MVSIIIPDSLPAFVIKRNSLLNFLGQYPLIVVMGVLVLKTCACLGSFKENAHFRRLLHFLSQMETDFKWDIYLSMPNSKIQRFWRVPISFIVLFQWSGTFPEAFFAIHFIKYMLSTKCWAVNPSIIMEHSSLEVNRKLPPTREFLWKYFFFPLILNDLDICFYHNPELQAASWQVCK